VTAYVLIDFENVQPKELGAFGGGGYKVMVFVGQGQASIPVGLASALQELGGAGSYIQIEGRGPNALDMHIAYYIGRIAATDPGAVFHVISRDRDYDPLIRHLKVRHIECTRWKSIAEINAARLPAPRAPTPKAAPKPAAKAAPAKSASKAAPKAAAKPAPKAAAKAPSSRVDEVIRNLEKRANARPSTLKALASTIKSHFRPDITDKEVATLVEELKLRGVVVIDGDKVKYQLA